MNEHDPRTWPQTPLPWQPPSPYVTHADMAPMHTKIGSLERGQESIISSYGHLRGEMLHSFDELKAIIRASQTPAPTQESRGVTMSMHSVIVAAVALILAGIVLSRVPGIEQLLGAQ